MDGKRRVSEGGRTSAQFLARPGSETLLGPLLFFDFIPSICNLI